MVGAQGVLGGGAVAVHDEHRSLVPGVRELSQHGDDRGHADAGGGQEQRGVGAEVTEHEIAAGRRQAQPVAGRHARVEVVRDLAVGRGAAARPLHADLAEG